MTLLELLIVLVAIGVVIFIALPTLEPTAQEEKIEFAKAKLAYLHSKEQEYYNLHGTYAPISTIAADPIVGKNFDQRFTQDENLVNEVRFTGPTSEGRIYDIIAVLPDGTRYKVNQTGQVSPVQ
jgi:type II secretory pathway pseudopilin PulG